jgi:hypothetical protein
MPMTLEERLAREKELRLRYRVSANQRASIRTKYVDCEYVSAGSRRLIRKLSDAEIAEFQRAIDRRIDRKLGIAIDIPKGRRAIV